MASAGGGEGVGGGGGVFDVGPAGGDEFGAGVEGDAFGAVDVLVAEQGVFPAAEGVEGHRDRDRHVDADHADVDAALEPAGGAAAVGVEGGGAGGPGCG